MSQAGSEKEKEVSVEKILQRISCSKRTIEIGETYETCEHKGMNADSGEESREPLLRGRHSNDSNNHTDTNDAGTTEVHITADVTPKPTMDILLRSEQQLNTRRHLWQAQIHALLGPEPPYALRPEDRAGFLFGRLYHTWTGPLMSLAARGVSLVPEDIPLPTRDVRAFNSGLRLLQTLEEQKFRRFGWDSYTADGDDAAVVRHRRDRQSVGLLRWVGPVQQLRRPRQMYAGVEWKSAPRHRVREQRRSMRKREKKGEELDTNGEKNVMPFHNGVIDGEHLFSTTDGAHTATCEAVGDIVFISPFQSQGQERQSNPQGSTRKTYKNGIFMPITSQKPPKHISVARALFDTFGSSVYILIPIQMLQDACQLAAPVILQKYIEYVQMSDQDWKGGVALVATLCFFSLVQSAAGNKLTQMSRRVGLTFHNALLTVLFTKCATVARKGLAHPDMSVGRIVNMVSNDVGSARSLPTLLPIMVGAPLRLAVGALLLYQLVGLSALAGLGVVLVFLPLQGVLMGRFFGFLNTIARLRDERLKATNELLSGIRVAKYMSWEPALVCQIEKKRREELKALRSIQHMYIIVAFLSNAVPSLVVAAVFVLFHVLGNELTPTVVFPTIALFRLIQMPFIMIPVSVSAFSRFIVSMRRISAFLENDDVESGLLEMQKHERDGRQIRGPDHIRWSLIGGDSTAVIEFMNAAISTYAPHKLPPCESELKKANKKGKSNGGITGDRVEGGDDADDREGREDIQTTENNNGNAGGGRGHGHGQSHAHGHGHGHGAADGTTEYYEVRRKELLHNVTLRIPKGSLTCIVGETGCGKSTLLESLLPGGYEITSGTLRAPATVAYVPQQPWIMNATLRENILFFSDMDEARFRRALRCAQLDCDLELLANGVETEIGENGVNLSGGQKARVGLARALYAERDVYLLDDPLSALDVHVGEKVLQDCLLGELSGTTRVLATHQLHVLRHADLIVVLGSEGTTVFTGNYEEYKTFTGEAAGDSHRGDDDVNDGQSANDNSGCDETHEGISTEMPRERDDTMGPGERDNGVTTWDPLNNVETTSHGNGGDAAACESPLIDDYCDDSPAETGAASGKHTKLQKLSPLEDGKKEVSGKLMTDEEVATGSVPFAIYARYAAASGGAKTCVPLLILFVLTEVVMVSPFLWLSFFTMKTFNLPVNTYLFVYGGLVFASVLCSPLRWATGYGVLRAGSYRLFERLLRSVVAAPMSFFDTTPLGRVINRFSKDMTNIDEIIPDSIVYFVQCALSLTSSVAVMVASQYLVIAAIIPCGFIYYRLMLFYNNANRELRRVTNRVSSPVFSILGEMLAGRSCMDAFGKTPSFLTEALRRVDVVSACSYVEVVCNCWLAVRIDLLVTVVLTAISGLGVYLVLQFGTVDVGLLSLSLTMAVNISTILTSMVGQAATVEANMNSVERVLHYAHNIEHEDLMEDMEKAIKKQEERDRQMEKNERKKNKKGVASAGKNRMDGAEVNRSTNGMSGPNGHDFEAARGSCVSIRVTGGAESDEENGGTDKPSTAHVPSRHFHYTTSSAVEFCNVSMRYRQGQPLVLRDLTFRITTGQKVGVIGRTGSGKSSLLLTLLRMVDIEGGNILIEGHPIRSYRLRKLRQLFSVIPQDPVLFDGTLRDNLDPLHTSSDEEIFETLRLVGMQDRITSSAEGLRSRVVDCGANFSVGQRQLLCMARALLRRDSRFVLMDEATANIDPALDRQLQYAIRHTFVTHTVITVAHRLHTLASYDLLLLLKDGRVVETGRPRDLVMDENSRFSRMVAAMGENALKNFMEATERDSFPR